MDKLQQNSLQHGYYFTDLTNINQSLKTSTLIFVLITENLEDLGMDGR